MENIINNQEHKIKTTDSCPQYFGAYLNMARHNVFLIINHLTERFKNIGFKKLSNDEDIAISEKNILLNIFNPTNKEFDDERKKVYNYLIKRHNLPLLKIFNQELLKDNDKKEEITIDYDKLHKFLNISFKELNNFRNAYSHNLAIDDSGNELKRKKDIDNSIKQDIELLFNYAPHFSFIRNQKTQIEEDYEHLKKYKLFEENSNEFTDQGLFFFINLFLERSYATKFLKKFRGFKNETTPPFKATIQAFTSYCLKIPDIRLGNENPKYSLLMEMLNELNRCPDELFNHLTEKNKKEFALELEDKKKQNIILNSINYDIYSEEELEDAIKDLVIKKRHKDSFPDFALRFIDEMDLLKNIRFQITLGKLIINRYDKEINGCFQDRRVLKTINAYGKLSDFIDKEQEIVATLKKGFEINDKIEFEQYAPHYNKNNNKIAFYIFNKDTKKIKYPILFKNKKQKTELQNNPSGFISIYSLPKLLLLENILPKKAEYIIKNFIQNTNLKIFDKSLLDEIKEKTNFEPKEFTKRIPKYKDLKGRDGKITYLSDKIEQQLLSKYKLTKETLVKLNKDEFKKKIKTINKKDIEIFSQIKYQYYLQERRKELQQYLPNGINVNHLPRKTIDYLMDISNTNKRIHFKIREIKSEAKYLLKSINIELKKQKNEQQIKLGELATFLTRDIINMIIGKPDEKDKTKCVIKSKITQPYVNKIQNKIAYFSLNKNEIIQIFDELNLFNKDTGHVFLTKDLINISNGLIEFYQKYLKEKINWINNNLLKQGKKGGCVLLESKKLPLTFQKIKTQVDCFNFENWLNSKSIMPVNLPSTLFVETLNKILKKNLKKENIAYGVNDKFSVLLSKLLKNDTQPFYIYLRKYNINKKSIDFSIHNLSSFKLKNKYDKNVENNEKLIRFTQTKDRIIKLLCDKLLEEDKSIGLKEKFVLKYIHPYSKLSPLDRPARFEQKIFQNAKETKSYITIIAEDTIKQTKEVETFLNLKTKEEREKYTDIKGYQWTFKDFGRFKRFVKDRRILNLSKYFEVKKIPFDLLEYQIKEYDKYREKIFDLTFRLEEKIKQKDFDGLKKLKLQIRPKSFNEIQFDIYIEWLNNKKIDYNEYLIKHVRNKFSHSEFPYCDFIQKITNQQMDDFEYYKDKKEYKNTVGLSIAKKIYLELEKEINKIMKQINN